MDHIQRLKKDYPWIQTPVVVGAPMRLIALAEMAVEITKAGGIGFLGAGTSDISLPTQLQKVQTLLSSSPPLLTRSSTLPIGIGFINWGADLASSLPHIQQFRPAAVWFFSPSSPSSLQDWTQKTRQASPDTKIWIQVGSVAEALAALDVQPDVLVVQGTDAGGHGLARGAGLLPLFPEVQDAVTHACQSANRERPILIAAGGVVEARSAAAALTLGAEGVVLGTRLLASHEAVISPGYKKEVLRASDGGQTTVRTKVYDDIRGTTGWADTYNGRGVINRSFEDAVAGMSVEENKKLYGEEMEKGDSGWGPEARMTTYAGTGVGLVREIMGAGEIVGEVREGARRVAEGLKL
ncbi:inosine monophosphate dehydrogenase [Polyplosphaeria fusca]|uniref:Inosine monophosphate dehydrogenase n=1 Tax=Polyplosphaeria fusca TaxID=682080 RepID=A0A9P4R769_9PLEO|nr:inosine monophosphate dehydrogenase [Polyplosphaeria fusca]